MGLCSEMTKGQAREAVAEIVKRIKKETNPKLFGPFVEGPYFEFYTGKWKSSTADNNKQRIRTHLVEPFCERDMASFRRDELQELLNGKSQTHSFSVVDHLRWDLKQIFDMAIAEGLLRLSPAALLFTPSAAKRPTHRVMTVEQIRTAFDVLATRERVIFKLAILGGMRPGEIFVLRRKRLAEASAEITERIYRGKIDTPKTHHSVREAALADGLKADLENWSELSSDQSPEGFVFPSERGTALSKDNVWRRNMQPKLAEVGLGWCNFQTMRRTHGTLMRSMKEDPHAVAAQLGHTVDVSLNVYAQSPVEDRRDMLNRLEKLVIK
jgi:integrase